MHDDAPFGRGYSPHHGGWLSTPEKVRSCLSSDELLRVSSFLDALDESGAIFTGTVQFDGHSFPVGFNPASEEHFITVQ